jgi:hypothetical protein
MKTGTESGMKDTPVSGATILPAEVARDYLSGRPIPNTDDFAVEIRKSAENTGCRFLFEFPAMLIDESADKAAVILCPDENGFSLVFLVYDRQARNIRIVESGEAPMQLVDFSWSFARVLSFLSVPAEPSLQ